MKSETHKTAPLGQGWTPCLRCRKYRHPDDLERGYCKRRCKPSTGPSAGQVAANALRRGGQ